MAPKTIWRDGHIVDPQQFTQFQNGRTPFERERSFQFTPASELIETELKYQLKIDLPGVRREDLKVEVTDDQLSLIAQRQEPKDNATRKYLSEISYGYFYRMYKLPETVEPQQVNAKLEDGVLVVSIEKGDRSHIKRVQVQ